MKTTSTILFALVASSASSALAFAPSSGKPTKAASTTQHGVTALDRMEWTGVYTNLDESKIMDKIPGTEKIFDPFGFTDKTNNANLMAYREAEIKHARLAMLAAASWPIAELLNKPLAATFGATPIVDNMDRNPDILNGGLSKVNPLFWGGVLMAAALIDLYQINVANNPANEDYFPGNLGFDPLGLYPKDKKGQLIMQQKEIENGRLAMIAITAFAVQEYVSQSGIIDETPALFKPFFM